MFALCFFLDTIRNHTDELMVFKAVLTFEAFDYAKKTKVCFVFFLDTIRIQTDDFMVFKAVSAFVVFEETFL
jgi:hypothetical protein